MGVDIEKNNNINSEKDMLNQTKDKIKKNLKAIGALIIVCIVSSLSPAIFIAAITFLILISLILLLIFQVITLIVIVWENWWYKKYEQHLNMTSDDRANIITKKESKVKIVLIVVYLIGILSQHYIENYELKIRCTERIKAEMIKNKSDDGDHYELTYKYRVNDEDIEIKNDEIYSKSELKVYKDSTIGLYYNPKRPKEFYTELSLKLPDLTLAQIIVACIILMWQFVKYLPYSSTDPSSSLSIIMWPIIKYLYATDKVKAKEEIKTNAHKIKAKCKKEFLRSTILLGGSILGSIIFMVAEKIYFYTHILQILAYIVILTMVLLASVIEQALKLIVLHWKIKKLKCLSIAEEQCNKQVCSFLQDECIVKLILIIGIVSLMFYSNNQIIVEKKFNCLEEVQAKVIKADTNNTTPPSYQYKYMADDEEITIKVERNYIANNKPSVTLYYNANEPEEFYTINYLNYYYYNNWFIVIMGIILVVKQLIETIWVINYNANMDIEVNSVNQENEESKDSINSDNSIAQTSSKEGDAWLCKFLISHMLISASILMLFSQIDQIIVLDRKIHCTEETVATIVDFDQKVRTVTINKRRKRHYEYGPIIQYDTNDGAILIGDRNYYRKSKLEKEDINIGDEMYIHYNPDRPTQFYTSKNLQPKIIPVVVKVFKWITIILICLCGIFIYTYIYDYISTKKSRSAKL